jgi:hypothetical protein
MNLKYSLLRLKKQRSLTAKRSRKPIEQIRYELIRKELSAKALENKQYELD